MKCKKLLRVLAIMIVVSFIIIFAGPSRIKNEWFRNAYDPVLKHVRVEQHGYKFVLDVCDVLEDHYFAADSLNYPRMFNSALHGISIELEYDGITFVPDTIGPECTEDQAKDIFEDQFDKAEKLAESAKDSVGHTLEFVAADSLLESLGDSHCYFIDPSTRESIENFEKGKASFSGIGISLSQIVTDGNDTVFYLNDVSPNTPASKAGLKKFDRILEINDSPVEGKSPDSVRSLIRGEKGTEVELTMKRKNDIFKVIMLRDGIVSPFWSADTLKDCGKTFIYLRIYSFRFSSSALDQIRNYLSKAQFGADGIIIDLRGNGGGYIRQMRNLLEIFLQKGSLEYCEVGKGKDTIRSFSPGGISFKSDLPAAVLIDRGSASASEMFSAALQENGRAFIVGQKSSCSVNIANGVDLSFGAEMSVSEMEVFSPHGKRLEKNGVTPDFPVELTREGILNGEDSQIQKALQVLEDKIDGK